MLSSLRPTGPALAPGVLFTAIPCRVLTEPDPCLPTTARCTTSMWDFSLDNTNVRALKKGRLFCCYKQKATRSSQLDLRSPRVALSMQLSAFQSCFPQWPKNHQLHKCQEAARVLSILNKALPPSRVAPVSIQQQI